MNMMSMKMAVRLPAAKTIATMTWREVQRASSIVSAALAGTVGSCTILYDVTGTMSIRMAVRLTVGRMIANMT